MCKEYKIILKYDKFQQKVYSEYMKHLDVIENKICIYITLI